jgi:hypothetical protein
MCWKGKKDWSSQLQYQVRTCENETLFAFLFQMLLLNALPPSWLVSIQGTAQALGAWATQCPAMRLICVYPSKISLITLPFLRSMAG